MLEVLTPNFDKWDHSTVQNWIKKLHKAGNSIETVLTFQTEPNSEAEALKIANRSTSLYASMLLFKLLVLQCCHSNLFLLVITTHFFPIFYRYNWQRICVIKLFAEHIGLKFIENEIIVSARRLWMVIIYVSTYIAR